MTKSRWCYEHIAPVGARAEMLRIRGEAGDGPRGRQPLSPPSTTLILTARSTLAATTRLDGLPRAPLGVVAQFFHRGTTRGDQFRADYQKLYDDGIRLRSSIWANSNPSTLGPASTEGRSGPCH